LNRILTVLLLGLAAIAKTTGESRRAEGLNKYEMIQQDKDEARNGKKTSKRERRMRR
jgi:hypothetical protein